MARYGNRPLQRLTNIERSDMIRQRGVRNIIHYASPKFQPLPKEMYDSEKLDYMVWKVGSRFYKLAHEYYGDSRLWWIIAYFNRKPTDSHVKLGDVIYIPYQWEAIYDLVQSGRYEEDRSIQPGRYEE